MVWVPSIEYLLSLFEKNIKTGNIINQLGLASTLNQVEWGIPYFGIPSIWDQVTILYKEIVENHYFSDGNKRIGVLISVIFLDKNGYDFSPAPGEIYKMTLLVAQGLKSYEDLKSWFEKNSIKIL